MTKKLRFVLYVLSIAAILVACKKKSEHPKVTNTPKVTTTETSKIKTTDTITTQIPKKEKKVKKNTLYGCLHGEGRNRPENFDSIADVTIDNIYALYALYDIVELNNGEYFHISSKKFYTNSRYLSRIIRMENGKQVAAHTFYDYCLLLKFVEIDGKLFFALNSPAFSGYSKSSFCCKLVMMDKNFKTLKTNTFRPGSNAEYCWIDTIYQKGNNIALRVEECLFDPDEMTIRSITVDKKNRVIGEKKRVTPI